MKMAALPLLLCLAQNFIFAADSLPPLTGLPPQTVEQLWAGYDPNKEPLEVEVVHEWTRNGITTRMLVYTIGTFKGVKSRMGAYYAFPAQAGGKMPGLLYMHGGGQRAQRETVEAAAENGYAAISINWGGKAMDDQNPGDAGTDWGAVDATQTTHNTHYNSLAPDAKTLDSVESPRNSNWYLIVIGARRALTFLQQQPQVDPQRLGVAGHSMGGKLTVMTAGTDSRVKAAVPSCGGTGRGLADLNGVPPTNAQTLSFETIDDIPYLRRITCPILYTGPQNDFNGHLDNLYANWQVLSEKSPRFSISPHFNHRHLPEAAFAGPHFFDVYLKGEGSYPNTPELKVDLHTADHVPQATLKPDRADDVVTVQIFYTIDPQAVTCFWRSAAATRHGNEWTATCPTISTELPMRVMANVFYRLPKPIVGPPWEAKSPETFLVSSWGKDFAAADLQSAGVKATESVERLIQGHFEDWRDWYQLSPDNPVHHQAITRKIKDPKWRGPDAASLTIDVLDPTGGELALTFEMNGWNAYVGSKQGSYYAAKPIAKSSDWQTIQFTLADLKPFDEKSAPNAVSWQYLTELGLVGQVHDKGQKQAIAGSAWTSQRQIRNLRWVGGEYPKRMLLPGGKISEQELQRTFQAEITKSVEQEKRDANGTK